MRNEVKLDAFGNLASPTLLKEMKEKLGVINLEHGKSYRNVDPFWPFPNDHVRLAMTAEKYLGKKL